LILVLNGDGDILAGMLVILGRVRVGPVSPRVDRYAVWITVLSWVLTILYYLGIPAAWVVIHLLIGW
jgi:predicted secreted protein